MPALDATWFAWLLSVAAFAVAMSATPGPNNAMVAASGATWGFARTLWHILGVSVGFPVMLIAVALGAGELVRQRPDLHAYLTWVGAAYMLWLAFRIATARPAPKQEPARPEQRGPPNATKGRGRPLSFVEAALFQWVNPKAWVIALGAVATYTSAEAIVAQTLVIAAVFFVTCVPSSALWTAIGAGAARVLHTERAIRAFNVAMAALLVLSLVPLVAG